jgi:hypothetical protein
MKAGAGYRFKSRSLRISWVGRDNKNGASPPLFMSHHRIKIRNPDFSATHYAVSRPSCAV